MNHPFKVGQTYENTIGAYTVLDISPPKMQVQYEDGVQATLAIEIQGRIWQRIEDERVLAREEFERRTKVKRFKNVFGGFSENDFKNNVAGTSWRGREGLAGLVSRQLSDKSGLDFTSWAIYRRPQFFVYLPHLPMFNQAEGVKLPKFIVHLSEENVLYGLYIEKSDEVMNNEWYWPRFLKLLAETRWQEYIIEAMTDWGMTWILRFEEKIEGTKNYMVSADGVVSSFGEGSSFATFSEFLAYLQSLPHDQWCNLYLAKTMAKEEAIALREKVGLPISDMLNALSPLYAHLTLRSAYG